MVLAYMDARSLPGRDRAAAFVWNQSMFETLLVRARHSQLSWSWDRHAPTQPLHSTGPFCPTRLALGDPRWLYL